MSVRRFVLVLIVVMSVIPAAAVAASDGNQTVTENATATPTPTPTPVEPASESNRPYSHTELQKTGVTGESDDDDDSMRALGDPPMGWVSARYRDPTLLDAVSGNPGQWKDASLGQTVQQNEIQIYGSAFGDGVTGEYTLTMVFWQKDTVERNNESVPIAVNQTVKKETVTLSEENLYDYNNVSLPNHLDRTWQVTMWLTDESGDEVEGARWRFAHRSNPESKGIAIDSKAGLWGYSIANAVAPGILSLIIGLVLARATLRVTGRGPGYGLGAWLMVTGFVGFFVSLLAYYQIAVLLDQLPFIMGGSIGVIAYSAGLMFHEPVRIIGFWRRELSDAITIEGGQTETPDDYDPGDGGAEAYDEFAEATFADLPEVPAIRTAGGYRVPITGIRPFFARLFASSALLDLSGISTRESIRHGRIDDIIHVDPRSEPAVEHKPARIVRVLPWDTLEEDAGLVGEIWAFVLTLLIILGPPLAGAWAFSTWLNVPSVGLLLGLVVTAVVAHSAEDGWIQYAEAPYHYMEAENSLSALQRAHKRSSEEQSATEEARVERATTAKEAREDRFEEQRTVTDVVQSALGIADGVSDEMENGELTEDDKEAKEDAD